MKLGNKIIFFLFFFNLNFSYADDKILSTPLLNIEKIKPSFEELDEENQNILLNQKLKEKKIVQTLNPLK